MTETMLVRAAGGGWEELRPQTAMPGGGIAEMFGEDIGPVLGSPTSILVAACSPQLSTGRPDAICVDSDGGVWIVQLSLNGAGDDTLPQLLAFGGALSGTTYDAFGELCDRAAGAPLATFVSSRVTGVGFHRSSFEVAVGENLAHGRFHLVAVVGTAAPSLVQSMRFLNSTGARVSLYEASSFASASVHAVRARAVDVGTSQAQSAGGIAAMTAAGFVATTGKHNGEAVAALMAQLQGACETTFDEVVYEGDTAGAVMSAGMHAPSGPVPVLVAGSDGGIVVSFESLAELDPSWAIRAELCQGMERLLGADLGDVRKISQLNLSIGEHLMDATLMEALVELIGDTVAAVRAEAGDVAPGARAAVA